MDYYSDLNALPYDPVFVIEFECKNCGKEFARRFDANADVHPVGANKPNFIGINETDGNKYVAIIDHEEYPLQCDNCDIETSLYELNREPLDNC
jgi:hypothetical protein